MLIAHSKLRFSGFSSLKTVLFIQPLNQEGNPVFEVNPKVFCPNFGVHIIGRSPVSIILFIMFPVFNFDCEDDNNFVYICETETDLKI